MNDTDRLRLARDLAAQWRWAEDHERDPDARQRARWWRAYWVWSATMIAAQCEEDAVNDPDARPDDGCPKAGRS